ncbi:MAG: hypothetical protein ACKO34_05280 [Vampirovibrionales bacterium]
MTYKPYQKQAILSSPAFGLMEVSLGLLLLSLLMVPLALNTLSTPAPRGAVESDSVLAEANQGNALGRLRLNERLKSQIQILIDHALQGRIQDADVLDGEFLTPVDESASVKVTCGGQEFMVTNKASILYRASFCSPTGSVKTGGNDTALNTYYSILQSGQQAPLFKFRWEVQDASFAKADEANLQEKLTPLGKRLYRVTLKIYPVQTRQAVETSPIRTVQIHLNSTIAQDKARLGTQRGLFTRPPLYGIHVAVDTSFESCMNQYDSFHDLRETNELKKGKCSGGKNWKKGPSVESNANNIALRIGTEYSCTPYLKLTNPLPSIETPLQGSTQLYWAADKDRLKTTAIDERYPLMNPTTQADMITSYLVGRFRKHPGDKKHATLYQFEASVLPQTLLNVLKTGATSVGSFPYYSTQWIRYASFEPIWFCGWDYTANDVFLHYTPVKAFSLQEEAPTYLSRLELYRSFMGMLFYHSYNASPEIQSTLIVQPWQLRGTQSTALATWQPTETTVDNLEAGYKQSLLLNRLEVNSSNGIGASSKATSLGASVENLLAQVQASESGKSQNEIVVVVLASGASRSDTATSLPQNYEVFKQSTLMIQGVARPLHFMVVAPQQSVHVQPLTDLNAANLDVFEFDNLETLKGLLATIEEMIGFNLSKDDRERYTNHVMY